MTPSQVQSLHHFGLNERTWTGTPVAWEGYHYETMAWMDIFRQHLRVPISLIRGGVEHGPNKLTCVDAVAHTDFSRVVMGMMRLPGLSWGVYEGSSFHLDMRQYDSVPARWLAFRHNELREKDLFRRGFGELISGRKDSWIYMNFNHVRSFDVLAYLVHLNQQPSAPREVAREV